MTLTELIRTLEKYGDNPWGFEEDDMGDAMKLAAHHLERLQTGIQALLDGNYPNPREHRPGTCAHGTPYYEACGQCIDAHLTKLLEGGQGEQGAV